ncbi:MAG: PorV/PorQ family protein [Elusimicrobia bacterium]|nr:PorV/PorQ family protein [Elusimicrobiota bacterium]
MKRPRLIATLSLAALLAATAARAQSSAGADAFDFLRLDAGARAVGMGGAYTALATDANALLYNPAGLGRLRSSEATFMHNQYAQGIGQQYLAVGLKNGIGAQFNYASLGNVPRTTISDPSGSGGRLNVSDSSLGFGYGAALTPDLAVGGGLKYISESLGDATANGYAADLGGLYRMPDMKGLTFGASLLNLGPAVKFQSVREKLPTTLRLGTAYGMALPGNDVTLAFDITKGVLDKIRMGLGAETVVHDQFAIRAGFTTRQDAGVGLSFGLGWKGPKMSADYAFVPLGDLGTAHRISFTLRWGQIDDPAQAQAPEEGSPEAYLARAQAAMDRGETTAARSFLMVGLRLLPKGDRRRVRFQERLGSLLLMQKDFRGAALAYAEGVNQAFADGYSDESVADSYIGIGMCFTAGKNYVDAQRAFQKGLDLGPSPKALQLAQSRLKALKSAEAP